MPQLTRPLKIIIISLLFLSGCASSWDKQRKQLNRDYKKGKLSDDTYDSLMHKLDKDQRAFLQQSKDDKVFKQQAQQRKKEGYFIPDKSKNCTSKCDYYGNCETVCD